MSGLEKRIASFRCKVLERSLYTVGALYIFGVSMRHLSTPVKPVALTIMLGLGSVVVAVGVMLRYRMLSYLLASNILLALMVTTFLLMAVYGAGFEGPITAMAVLMPMFAAFFLGIRSSLAYTVIAIGVLAISYAIDVGGYIAPNALTPQQLLDAKLIVLSFVIIAAFIIASAYEHNRHRTESYLAKLNHELERAKQQAESALQIKSRFLANVSHEIRTPLTGILGMVALMRDDESSEETQKKLYTIESSGESLLGLLNDVLDAAKLESGLMELERVPVELMQLVSNVIEVVGQQAAAQGITVHVDIANRLPDFIEGDPVRLNQVLFNLIGNAIKFSAGNDVRVRVSADSINDDALMVRISVIDQGIGISQTAQDRLFKPFSQADSSTTRKYGGTGLGLSICKGLVDQMGGRIWVRSEKGEGSTFSFQFPTRAIESPNRKSGQEEIIKNLHGDKAHTAKPMRILVAEDNDVNRSVVEAFLGRLGYQADFAEDGLQAVEAVEEKEYDLLLMDCQMPNLDGFAATREIIKRYGGQRPRIIALTANASSEDRQLCDDAGMDGVITKPLRLAELDKTLRNVPLRAAANDPDARSHLN